MTAPPIFLFLSIVLHHGSATICAACCVCTCIVARPGIAISADGSGLEDGLPKDGTATMMNIEMNKEALAADGGGGAKSKKGKKKGIEIKGALKKKAGKKTGNKK